MSRVTWGDPGARFYETGVDRGVLYINNVGVAWSGITSISESPTGGEAKPYYMDGIKYLNIAGSEEFAATLEALAAPAEFGPCDGSLSINKGLFATQQPRKAFSLSYRTLIGNDTQGQNLGYKIHLVYNALAAPSERSRTTTGDEADPTTHSWSLTTLPPSLTGMKPTAHFVIDSRTTPKMLLKAIEDILYGSDAADPRMPLVSELTNLFASQGPVTRINLLANPTFRAVSTSLEPRRNLVSNPSFRATATSGEVRRNYQTDPRLLSGTGWSNITGNGVAGGAICSSTSFYSPWYTAAVGESWTVSVQLTAPAGAALTGVIAARGVTGGAFGPTYTSTAFTIPAGTTARVSSTGVMSTGSDGIRMYVTLSATNVPVDKVMIAKEPTTLPYFDGTTTAADGLTYSWTGAVNASASIASGLVVPLNTLQGYIRKTWKIVGDAEDGTDTIAAYIGHSYNGVIPNPLVLFGYDVGATVAAGDIVSARFKARLRNATEDFSINPRLFGYSSGGVAVSNIATTAPVVLPATGEWVDVIFDSGPMPATGVQVRYYVTTSDNMLVPAIIQVSNQQIEKTEKPGPWFEGASAPANGLTHSWVGTAHGSQSIATGSKPANWAASVATDFIWRDADGKSALVYHPTNGLNTWFYATFPVSPDNIFTTAMTFEMPDWALAPMTVFIATRSFTVGGNNLGYIESSRATLNPGESVRLSLTRTLEPTAGQFRVSIVANGVGMCRVRDVFAGVGEESSYFDGSMPDVDNNYYSWAGATDASASILNTWN